MVNMKLVGAAIALAFLGAIALGLALYFGSKDDTAESGQSSVQEDALLWNLHPFQNLVTKVVFANDTCYNLFGQNVPTR